MTPQRPLSQFVKPREADPRALHLEWHTVRRRVRRTKQVRAALVVASVLAVGVVAGLALRPGPQLFTPGQTVLTRDASQTVRLAEGSRVVVADNSSLELQAADATDVLLVLDHGRALFDVEKNPGRRFVVKADAVEVRVIGTRFTVQREGPQVSVSVERGIVEVRDGESVKRLERGASWTRPAPLAATARPGANDVEEGDEELSDGEPSSEAAGVDDAAPPAKRAVTPGKRKRSKVSKKSPDAQADDERPGVTAPVAEERPEKPAEPEATRPPEANPADTFAAAMRSRSDGRAKEAILGFQQVCERWPQSAYAPMSAFEWGRLALDSQGDARQAARAFERTLELATSASLIEDALARLTEAYAKYDAGSCRRAQADYLKRFPGGPHVRAVTHACPP